MNRYRHGFSTVEPSGLRSAHMRAQIKVENPVPLRTTRNFDLLPPPRASFCCRATLIYPATLIKVAQKIKIGVTNTNGGTDIARKKSAELSREDLLQAERGNSPPD
jgi:hypothetical protein